MARPDNDQPVINQLYVSMEEAPNLGLVGSLATASQDIPDLHYPLQIN
jgi:hypothetical protein